MKKYKDTDYLFASASIKSAEKNLLTHDRVEKMLDAKTPDEALKVLYELNYGKSSEEVAAGKFEHVLAEEHDKAYELVMSLAPEKEYFVVFFYPNDYHNLKVLLKSEMMGVDHSELLTDTGTVKLEELTELVTARNYLGMRTAMAKGVQEAVDSFSTTQDPQLIDLALDKACYADMNSVASELQNEFIRGYIARLIDTTNLKSFVRAREMNKAWDFFSKIFIEGGNISERTFVASYEEPLEQFADKLTSYGLQEVLAEGAAMIKDTGRFTALEKECDNAIMAYVKDAKYTAFGIEPLIGYIVAKDSEIKTARIIMAGKLAGLTAERLRERVRNTYV